MMELQKPITQVTAGSVKAASIAAIKTWEPRVSLVENECEVTPDLTLPGYRVKIVYRMKDAAVVYVYILSLKV